MTCATQNFLATLKDKSSEISFNVFELTCQKCNFQRVINIKKLMNVYLTFILLSP